MELNLKIKEEENGDAVYWRMNIKHLPEKTRFEINAKVHEGHVFDELELGQIIKGTYTPDRTYRGLCCDYLRD